MTPFLKQLLVCILVLLSFASAYKGDSNEHASKNRKRYLKDQKGGKNGGKNGGGGGGGGGGDDRDEGEYYGGTVRQDAGPCRNFDLVPQHTLDGTIDPECTAAGGCAGGCCRIFNYLECDEDDDFPHLQVGFPVLSMHASDFFSVAFVSKTVFFSLFSPPIFVLLVMHSVFAMQTLRAIHLLLM